MLKPDENKLGLVIIGTGEQQGKLLELVKSLGVEEFILFTGYQANPFSIMKHCDLYILSSLFEGFPNSMVEAMCLGLPVIASDCKSGPREILAPELPFDDSLVNYPYVASHGILLPTLSFDEDWTSIIDKDEKLWANVILTQILDSKILNSYSGKSIERAHAFSEEVCYERLCNILEDC